MLYIPSELQSLIAERLDKSNLKNLRFVSQQWCAVVSPLLFDRVYVSPWKKDLEVFAGITENPALASSIKTLIYDDSSFPHRSQFRYFLDLCEEILSHTSWLSKRFLFNRPDARLTQFVNKIIEREVPHTDLFSEYGQDILVTSGYENWLQRYNEEAFGMANGLRSAFFSALCTGLCWLPNLRTVNLEDDIWGSNCRDISNAFCPMNINMNLPIVPHGSPLARSWKLWDLRPVKPHDPPDGSVPKHLYFLINGLSRTQRNVKHFHGSPRFRNGFSPRIFATRGITKSFPRHMANAFSQLHSLDLQITPQGSDVIDHQDTKALGFLPHLLERLSGLKTLNLQLMTAKMVKRRNHMIMKPVNETCYHYSQVFPRCFKWPHLESLYLGGVAFDATDFCWFFTAQLPALQSLWLYRVILLNCRWEGAVEVLRYRGTKLAWNMISLQGFHQHAKGEWWPCTPDKESEYREVLGDHMEYIQNGGRHPSLPTSCDSSQSSSYLQDMII